MYVEVDDRHALQVMLPHRVACGDCDVIEEAEAHRPVRRSVVSRRARGAEHMFGVAAYQVVDTGTGAADGT